jgi:small GTP-binding protein
MYKTIGMVAHVDAGKTTLLEQILYYTNSIREAGRVDYKNTFLDYHYIEKERGITVFSDQGIANYNNCTYQFIDTPGHIDFSTEMERAVRILDYAVIIISAVEGIQGHTETVWQLLRKYEIPTIFFVNKLDRICADYNRVIKEINETLTNDILAISYPNSNNEISFLLDSPNKQIIEFIAERDDTIMEQYLEDEVIHSNDIIESTKKLFNSNKFYPCLSGIALKNIGTYELLKTFDLLTESKLDNKAPFSSTVYKIRYDKGNKLTYMKLHSGSISVKDSIDHNTNSEHSITEKINQIRLYNGTKYTLIDTASSGQLVAVTGLNSSYIGEGLGSNADYQSPLLVPILKSKVIYDTNYNPKTILKIFTILTEEDPSLDVMWIEILQEIHIKVMGTIHLEVLQSIVLERFNINVHFDLPEILYKETISSKTHGFGHFEPLKHYAEIEFDIEPTVKNSGISFSSTCSVDILHTRWQRICEKNIIVACQKGILTGSPLTDIHITLTTGKSHVKHTSGGDFRQATFRAIRQGIENTINVLLEPYYYFQIKVAHDLSGRVMTDIVKMHGTFETPITHNNNVIIKGTIPVSTSMNYPCTLASFTSGKGSISLVYCGYDICHNTDEVIKKYGYDKDSDIDYTSTSIFCSHGKAYSIKGSELK